MLVIQKYFMGLISFLVRKLGGQLIEHGKELVLKEFIYSESEEVEKELQAVSLM